MKLRGASFLTDENVHPDVIAFLRSQSCDVRDVKESGLIGSDDVTLLRLAVAEKRVVLTHDSDFGTLAVAANEPIIGIVYLRPGHILANFTIGTLTTLFNQELELSPPFLVVAQRTANMVKIRVRPL